MTRKAFLLTVSAVLFCLCFYTGSVIAAHKPLWVDELHTQFHSIQTQRFRDVFLSGAMEEGNNAPLYYLLQKWVNLIPSVQVSAQAYQDWIWADPKAQLVLRINAVAFMSLALCVVFYFFSSEFAVWAGIYAFLCALASPMVWLYWAEARPYSLWVLLTTVQMVMLVKIWRSPGNGKRLLAGLALTHVLLVLTSYLSMIQVFCAAVIFFFRGHRSIRSAAGLLFLPAAIAIFYRFVGLKLHYAYGFHWRYILDNLPLDRLVFILIALVFLYTPLASGRKDVDPADARTVPSLLGFVSLALACVAALLATVKFQKNPSPEGLSSRFFIFLTPAGIMLQALLARSVFRRYSGEPVIAVCLAFTCVLLGLVAFFNTSTLVMDGLKFL